MRFALDHVVLAYHDLAKAIAVHEERGFSVTPGGSHSGRTSHNALVVFDDGAYVELIAWRKPNPAERWNNVLLQHGEGFMDFALLPEDVPRAIAEARSRGLELTGPYDGSRLRPDGRELKWQTARQTTFDLPFLCGDVTPRQWRVPDGLESIHRNGALGIAKLVVAVKDAEVSAQRYAALLGAEPATNFEIGKTVIELSQRPLPPRGEGVVGMELHHR